MVEVLNFERIFKFGIILILLFEIYFFEKSRKIYMNLDSHEKELKANLFDKRTKFVIFIAILNIITLLIFIRIVGEFSKYIFILSIFIWLVFDYFDSKNKLKILE